MNPDQGDYGQDSPGQVLSCAVGIAVSIVLAILLAGIAIGGGM